MKKNIFKHTISLWIILTVVIATFSTKSIYYYDVDYFDIPKTSGYTKDVIIKNYDYLIDYNLSFKSRDFNLPDFKSSENGKIHFIEVRNLVQGIIKLDFLLFITAFLGIAKLFKRRDFKYLRWISLQILLIPLVLIIPFAINFSKCFEIFHRIFFRNDYWIFDPQLDPVINILPEGFFFHSAIFFIMSLITISLLIYIFYRNIDRLIKMQNQ